MNSIEKEKKHFKSNSNSRRQREAGRQYEVRIIVMGLLIFAVVFIPQLLHRNEENVNQTTNQLTTNTTPKKVKTPTPSPQKTPTIQPTPLSKEKALEKQFVTGYYDFNEDDNPFDKLIEMQTEEAMDILLKYLVTLGPNQRIKQHIIYNLSSNITEVSNEILNKTLNEFNEHLKTRFNKPLPNFRLKNNRCPIDHFGSYDIEPLLEVKDDKGQLWTLFTWEKFGKDELWIASHINDKELNEPILAGFADVFEKYKYMQQKDKKVSCVIKSNKFTITLGKDNIEFTLEQILKDTDSDGISDNVEKSIGTDPNQKDTDDDGIVDGLDGNPQTSSNKNQDDRAAIRQVIFNYMIATSSSRLPVVLVGDKEFTKQEYYGHCGFVLRSKHKKDNMFNITDITIKKIEGNKAEAYFSDWEGNLAARGVDIYLTKMDGKWYISWFGASWIS